MKNILTLFAFLAISHLAIAQQQPDNDIRINLGGPDVYNGGNTFQGDVEYPGYYSGSSIFSTPEGAIVPPPSIFHTERYGKALGGSLLYTIPVPNGTYTVRTHHAELFFGKSTYAPTSVSAGQRVFDILVEGVEKFSDHDLYLLNGNNPFTHTFENVTVNDGVLELEFDASVQRGNVSAISVEGTNANIHVNVGSDQDIDFNGNLYLGDMGKGVGPSNAYTNTTASTEPLLQTERYMASGETELTYGVPVPNGTYTIRTHHNELYFGKKATAPAAAANQRVFDILVEGVLKEDNFDLAAINLANGNAMGNPITREFTGITVTDGRLDLTLHKEIENPNVSGIAIERTDASGTDIYINVGGDSVVFDNKTYEAETSLFVTNNSGTSVYSDVTPVSSMFTTERYSSAMGGTLSYTIPVTANQSYTVKTHHNELYFGKSPSAPPTVSAGQRVFDILVEGALKEDDFDLFVKNGNNPYTNTFENITVGNDGILNIDFDASVQHANVTGISVEGPGTAIYINAGSSEAHTFLGNQYSGDVGIGHSASSPYTNTAASGEALLQTERYMAGNKTELTYGIPVPNGTYTVKTHHNELWFGKKSNAPAAAAGLRVFDILVEDVLKKDNFDLAAINIANGDPIGNAVTNTFTGIVVTDGTLNIDLVKDTDNPNISGISIERTDAGGTDIYINAGGGDTTYQGNTYLDEQNLFVTNNANGNVYNNDIVTGDLFQSERYATNGTLTITVPVENGVYSVETYHNELWFGVVSYAPAAGPNKRVKDITIEGTIVQDDFDLYTHTSGTNEPTILTYDNIEVTDGQLDLVLTGVIENPNLNGFAIIRTGDPGSLEEEGDETKAPYAGINLSNDQNYVLTRTYHGPMGGFAPVNESDVIEEVVYVDGLGRPMQQIALKASQAKKDIVTHIDYDDYGRMEREFLPFEPVSGANGAYRNNGESGTIGYYQSNYGADLDGTPNPFSQKEFEASPLNRVKKRAAPGKDWKLGSGHEILFDYQTNDGNDVLLFEVTFNGGDTGAPQLSGGTSYYPAGELYKNITKDENWTSGTDRTTEEYTDKQGRVLLKRTYNGTAHDTYYVYDDFGNLSYVLPPKVLVTTSNGVSTNEMNELCYQYKYDRRNRLIEKKIPGKGWEYIVYNKLDRPIMTKDALNPWLFTKYDAFGRVAYTGFANGGSRSSVQALADAHTTQWANQTGTTTINGISVYYDDGGYPAASNITKLHTINYYDGYNTARDGMTKPSGPIQGQALATNVQGLATVSKIRVLGEDDWITVLTAYDNKGRPVYTKSENSYLNTVDVIESKLDFAGKPVLTETSHQKDGATPIVTIDKLDYDHANRLLKQRQLLDGKTEMIAFNTYDGTGQLTEKKVGRTKANALQEVDYTYNIRGWLKAINQDTEDDNDLFDFAIKYNDPTSGTALFNGNISQTTWNTASVNNTPNTVSNAYTYSYDALNRIIGAVDNTTNYDLSNVTYDKNGNIQGLQRKGIGGTIDNLDYDYLNGETSNRLAKVADATNDAEGFNDGSNSGNDYTYDTNGNMTSDLNKGVTGITYNHLNLPEQVTVTGTDSGTVSYIYDATGVKLQKTVSGTSSETTEYAGNYIYENGNLAFFSTPEGYVEPNTTGGYDYIYQYKDHLGNIRLSYKNVGTASNVDLEIQEENNYYPFGLQHKGYNNVVNGVENNYQTFQGEELEEDLGKNTIAFQWRDYDPAIARFNKIDRFAERYQSMTPYHFSGNNPIFFREIKGDSIHPASQAAVDALKTNINTQVTSLTTERDAITAAATNRRGRVRYSADQQAQVDELNYRIGNLNSSITNIESLESSTEFTFKLNALNGNVADLTPSVADVNSSTFTLNYLSGDVGNQIHEVATHGSQIVNRDIVYSVNAAGTGVNTTIGNGQTSFDLEVAGYLSQYSYGGVLSGFQTPAAGSNTAAINNLSGFTGTANQINDRFTITNHSQINVPLIRSMTEGSIGHTTIY